MRRDAGGLAQRVFVAPRLQRRQSARSRCLDAPRASLRVKAGAENFRGTVPPANGPSAAAVDDIAATSHVARRLWPAPPPRVGRASRATSGSHRIVGAPRRPGASLAIGLEPMVPQWLDRPAISRFSGPEISVCSFTPAATLESRDESPHNICATAPASS